MAVVTGDDEQRAVSVSAPQQREMSGLTLLAGRPLALGPLHRPEFLLFQTFGSKN